MKNLLELLNPYLPETAFKPFYDLWQQSPVNIKIARSRTSKHGDYRPAQNGHAERISVNADLNPYAFLLTLIHEIAHQRVYSKYLFRSVKPHGKEWKQTYSSLLRPFVEDQIFPDEMREILLRHCDKPSAASNADKALLEVLRKYDSTPEPGETLFGLPSGTVFRIYNGRSFKKIENKRSRCLCLSLNNRRKYLVSGSLRVEVLS